MAFLVYAPFDELARGGVPMFVALGFKGEAAGTAIGPRFVAKARRASGCWTGTDSREIRRVLVVTRHRYYDRLFDQRVTVAAGYFTRTLSPRPYFFRTRHARLHASDPSICR